LLFTVSLRASILDSLIDVSIKDLTIFEALEELERLSGTNFSYQPLLFENPKKISYSKKSVKLKTVLTDILSPYNVSFHLLSNQIVLSRKRRTTKPETVIKPPVRQAKEPPVTIPFYDTVVQHVAVYDTQYVQVFDTLIVYDTLTVTKEERLPLKKQLGAAKSLYVLCSGDFSPWGSYSNSFDEYNAELETEKIYGAQFNAEILFHSANFALGTGVGVGYCSNNYNADVSYYNVDSTVVVGVKEYEKIEIIDVIKVVVINGERKEFVVKDTIISTDFKKEYKTDSIFLSDKFQNSSLFVSIPIRFQYRVWEAKTFSVNLMAGITTDIVVRSKANVLEFNEIPRLQNESYLKEMNIYSLRPELGIRGELFLNKKTSFVGGLSVQKRIYSNAQIKFNEPAFITITAGVRLGL